MANTTATGLNFNVDFPTYDTVADGQLTKVELETNGKLEGFVDLLIDSKIPQARAFISTVDQPLWEYVQTEFKIRLDDKSLDSETHKKIETLLNPRRTFWQLDSATRASQSSVSLGESSSQSESVSQDAYFLLRGFRELPAQWRIKGMVIGGVTTAAGRYAVTQPGSNPETESSHPADVYLYGQGGVLNTNRFAMNLSGTYQQFLEALPDSQQRRYSLSASLGGNTNVGKSSDDEGSSENPKKVMGGALSISTSQITYTPPLIEGQESRLDKRTSVSGEFNYQHGRHGLLLKSGYTDATSASPVDVRRTLSTSTSVGLQTQRIKKGGNEDGTDKELGITTARLSGGYTDASSTLTGLTIRQGFLGMAAEFQRNWESVSLVTSASAAANRADGSLAGWFPDAGISAKITYVTPDRGAEISLGTNVAGYARKLSYVGDESTPAGPQGQRSITATANLGVAYTTDRTSWNTAFSGSLTRQGGFAFVNQSSLAWTASGWILLTPLVRPLRVELAPSFSAALYRTDSESGSYTQRDVGGYLNLSIKK